MQIQPSELNQKGYLIKLSLPHRDLLPFIQACLRINNLYRNAYIGLNVLFLALLILQCFMGKGLDLIHPLDRFGYATYGVLASFLLVPLHEYIHVLAYRSQGATKTSYDVQWKKFVFMALADQFVANEKEFRIIALAPFIVISCMMILLYFLVGPVLKITALAVLFTHTSFCSGDFGMMAYFKAHQHLGLVTYDDVKRKVSYFYEKVGG